MQIHTPDCKPYNLEDVIESSECRRLAHIAHKRTRNIRDRLIGFMSKPITIDQALELAYVQGMCDTAESGSNKK